MRATFKLTKTRSKGFTMVEILGVAAVIAVLSVVAILGTGLARCTILQSAAERELQTLNSAYHHYLGAGGVAPQSNDPLDAIEAMSLPVNGMGPFIQHRGDAMAVFNRVCNGPVPVTFDPPIGFLTPPPTTPPPTPTPTPTPAQSPSASPTPSPMTISVTGPSNAQVAEVFSVSVTITNPNATATGSVSIPPPSGMRWIATVGGAIVGGSIVWTGSVSGSSAFSAEMVAETEGTKEITGSLTSTYNQTPATASLSVVVAGVDPDAAVVGGNNLSGHILITVNTTAVRPGWPGYTLPPPVEITSFGRTYTYTFREVSLRGGALTESTPGMTGWTRFLQDVPHGNVMLTAYAPGSGAGGATYSMSPQVFIHSSVSSAVVVVQMQQIAEIATFWARYSHTTGASVVSPGPKNIVMKNLVVVFNRADAGSNAVGGIQWLGTRTNFPGTTYFSSSATWRFQGRPITISLP